MFKIEKGVHLPSGDGRTKYPFAQMKVGDSFALESAEAVRLRMAAIFFGKRHKKKFSVRQDGESHRCWRVA